MPSKIDIRTDVYALGIVLYEMLTGGRPFETGESMSDVIKAITDLEPDPPSSKGPDLNRRGTGEGRVGPEIDAIVLKALAKNPDRRYQSVEHFHKDIELYLAGEPIDAKRDSKWYVFRKTIRRYRAAVAVIVTFLLFAIGYGATMSVLYGRAVLAEQQAVRQASRAEAINDFMVDMLESADPKGGSPSEMTIRELLDDIAARIETDLADQPHVAAAVHSSVGNTYRNLALFEKAEVHLRASVEAARSSVGVEHVDYAGSLSDLGLLLHDVGRLDESESLLRESVALMRTLKGDDSTELATAQGNLAVLLYAKGDLAGAEVLFRVTLAHDRIHLEPDDPDIVFSLVNLAALTSANEHYDDAIALYREALDLLQKLFGEDAHPLIGTVMRGLAISLESMEDFDAAEQMYRKSIAVSRTLLGEDHPDVAEGMSNLGTMLREAKRNLPEAEQLLTDALAMRRKLFGPDHPNVAVTQNDLARLKHVKGENKAAEDMHREAIAILGKTFPDDHWEIAYVESSLGETLIALRRFEEAQRLLIRSHAIIEAERGATHAATRNAVKRIGDLYNAWHTAEPGKGYDANAAEWRAKLPKADDADNEP
ncbi:MAG: tetratricopeptide repeat protein [Planctomycetes bacterium]|nr:tetratricopeptide repeat protein [Planctomycetota bacterium]